MTLSQHRMRSHLLPVRIATSSHFLALSYSTCYCSDVGFFFFHMLPSISPRLFHLSEYLFSWICSDNQLMYSQWVEIGCHDIGMETMVVQNSVANLDIWLFLYFREDFGRSWWAPSSSLHMNRKVGLANSCIRRGYMVESLPHITNLRNKLGIPANVEPWCVLTLRPLNVYSRCRNKTCFRIT